MNDVTRILDAIGQGDARAAAQLMPLVYDELRRLAAERMAREKPPQTLQPTALVHEAYLRLVGPADIVRWDGRGHFFAAAAEAIVGSSRLPPAQDCKKEYCRWSHHRPSVVSCLNCTLPFLNPSSRSFPLKSLATHRSV